MEDLKLASVRFPNTGKTYYFSTNLPLHKNDLVVVETARGIEIGEISKELEDIAKFNLNTELKMIKRFANNRDINNYEKNNKDAVIALEKCHKVIERLGLDMHLINCEYTLDRAKIIFMYTSEDRVDFRELLKELAHIFRCRIELKQIGPRDKAKIVGGIGTCGLPLCCSNMLGEFNGVSINMAKNQMLAINIDKISGACGRLMCCLKYEDDLYTIEKKRFPKLGSFMAYEGTQVKIIGFNILNDEVKIEREGNIMVVGLTELSALPTIKEVYEETRSN